MKQFLKDYLTFNKGDRNGILVLLFFIFALLFCLSILNGLTPSEVQDFNSFNNVVAELQKAKVNQEASDKTEEIPELYEKQTNYSTVSKKSFSKPFKKLFAFNPSNLPEEKWKALGLSEKQIKIIKNYEKKGGKFYSKEDVKKIYGIQARLYAQLEPYIQIPKNRAADISTKKWVNYTPFQATKKQEPSPNPLATELLEINSADTAKLKNLKGIGSTFAKRILSYREKLGGFISFSQLYEVWGMDSERVNMIIPQLSLNKAMIRKIPINHCTITDLKKLPYLSYNIANNIVLYRDRHGDYTNIQDIKLAVLVNEELFRKIAPYLTLD